jgi:predicted transcriptional regulator
MPPKDTAPLPAMTTYTRIIFQKLFDLHSMSRNFVRTSVLAGHVCKNDRSVREVLVWLEANGYAKRKGQRGGWMPVVKPDALPPLVKPVWASPATARVQIAA